MLQTTSRNAQAPPGAQPSLASWYAPGLSDGLGDRLLMFDNSAAPSLELLRFRPDFADRPQFEAALREQVQRLSRFEHPAFARVRSVQRLEPDGDLALVSNHTPGKRLSEILHRAHGPAFAAAMIRQLVPALAELQQHHPGAAHGLLTPDRVVVSPEARLTIVEHVVAPAIESLRFDVRQLAALGITVPPCGAGAAELSPSTDWYQVGLVALSAVLGRPVTPADLPQLDVLVGQAVDVAVREAAAVAPLLRGWLERSLQIDGPGLESAGEARALFAALMGERASAASRVLPMRPAQPPPAPRAEPRPVVIDVPAPAVLPTVIEAPPLSVAETFPSEATHRAEPAVQTPRSEPAPLAAAPGAAAVPPPAVTASLAQVLSPFEREVLAGRIQDNTSILNGPTFDTAAARPPARRFGPLAAVAAGQAVILAGLAASAWLSKPPAFGIEPGAANEHVLMRNGQPSDRPVAIALGPELSWVRMTTPPGVAVPGGKAEDAILRISSPTPLKVMAAGKVLGAVPGADLKLPPGRHDLELVNEAVEYRLSHSIDIAGGESVLIQVAPRPGTMTLEATVGTEVAVDGRSIGRTPMATVTLVPGVYDVAFRYAKGATDRQRVTVKSDATTAVVARAR